MIHVTEEQMDSGDWFVRVKQDEDAERVFFEGDYNCLERFLTDLGMEQSTVLTLLDSFENVKL